MRNVYGIGNHSLVFSYDQIKPICEKHGIELAVVDPQKPTPPKGQMYFFPNWVSLRNNLDFINGKKVVAVVFDTPVQLRELGISYWDMEQSEEAISYSFRLGKLNMESIRAAVLRLKRNKIKPIKLVAKTYDPIPTLLQTLQAGKLLTLVNNLTYNATGTRDRNTFRLTVTRYLFEQMSFAVFRTELRSLWKKDSFAQRYVEELIAYFETEEGSKFKKVCDEIRKRRLETKPATDEKKAKKAQLQYSLLAKKHGVNAYELKYMAGLYRKALREGTLPKNVNMANIHEDTKVKEDEIAEG
jgi:hypothetical protein